MRNDTKAIVIAGAAMTIVFIVIVMFGFAAGFNITDAKNQMLFGDVNWTCGYIQNFTTLEDIRNCFK